MIKQIKLLFILINILIACFVSMPMMFADGHGGGGDDSGSDNDDEDSEADAINERSDAVADAVGNAIADAINSGVIGEATGLGLAGQIDGTLGGMTPDGAFSGMGTVSTPQGDVSVGYSIDANNQVSVSVSVTTKSGQGVDSGNGGNSFDTFSEAIQAQEEANAIETEEKWANRVYSGLSFLVGLFCSACGLAMTAIKTLSDVMNRPEDVSVLDATIESVVEGSLVAKGINFVAGLIGENEEAKVAAAPPTSPNQVTAAGCIGGSSSC